MSGSISEFIDDAGDEIEEAIDDAATEVGDAADDVADEVDDNDDATGTPSPGTPGTGTASASAQVTRLYDAAFDRVPEEQGLNFWVNALQSGAGLEDIAEALLASPEFQSSYGDLGNGEFVEVVYQNALEREAEPEGLEYWTSGLENDLFDRDQVLVAISQSQELLARSGSGTEDPLV